MNRSPLWLAVSVIVLLATSCRIGPEIRPLENEILLNKSWRIDSMRLHIWETSKLTKKQKKLIQTTDYQFAPASAGPAKLQQSYYDFDEEKTFFRYSDDEEIRFTFLANGELDNDFAHRENRSLDDCAIDLTLEGLWAWRASERLSIISRYITEAYFLPEGINPPIDEYEVSVLNEFQMVLEARILFKFNDGKKRQREAYVKMDLSPVACKGGPKDSTTSDLWTLLTDIPENIDNAFSTSTSDKIYLITGSQVETALKSVWEYNPDSDKWLNKSPFAGKARFRATGFRMEDQIVVGTGVVPEDGIFAKDFWLYNTLEDQWSMISELPGAGRSRALGFSIGGKGYVGTGQSINGDMLGDFWEYEPQNNQWTQVPDLAGAARAEAVAFSLNGAAYVALGIDANGEYLQDCWQYDPTFKQWTQMADFPANGRGLSKAISLNGKAYVFGGLEAGPSGSTQYKEIWQYDPIGDKWTQLSDYPGSSKYNLIGGSVQDKIYVGGHAGEFFQYLP